MRFRNRIHRAAIEVANAIGGGWENFRLSVEAIKGVVFAPQAAGERLLELFSSCYLKAGTDRPKLDHRGDIVIAVEKLVGPTLEGDFRNYVVTTHQRRYLASADFLRQVGISASHPILLPYTSDRQELRALLLATRWGEAQGYFEKSWSVRKDGSLEVSLTPSGRPVDSNPEDVELFQFNTSKTDDTRRLRWLHILESKRVGKTNTVSYPLYEYYTSKDGWVDMVLQGTWTEPFDLNDPQDRKLDESDVKPSKIAVNPRYRTNLYDSESVQASTAYEGLVPLGSPSLEENQLWKREVRARMGWEVRAIKWDGKKDSPWIRISRDKVVLCQDGRIWKPETEDGEYEQDFFADPRQVLTWKDKETGRWIRIQRWNKLVMQKHLLTFKVPTDVNEQGYQLYETVRGRDRSSDEVVGLLHDKSVIVQRDSTFRRELEGMFLSAVEEKAYAKYGLQFFYKTTGLGSPDKPMYTEVKMDDGSIVRTMVPCKRCNERAERMHFPNDIAKAMWVEMPHAWVCNACGAEIWKVGVRVAVAKKFFPFVVHRDPEITHYVAEFYGHWVLQLITNRTMKRDRINYTPHEKKARRRAKKHRPFDPHERALHELRRDIIRRHKRAVIQDLIVSKRIERYTQILAEDYPEGDLQ